MGPQPWRTECPPCGPDEFCDKQGFPECLKCDDGPCDPYRFNKELCKMVCPEWTGHNGSTSKMATSSLAPSRETPVPDVNNMWIVGPCLGGAALLLVLGLLLLIWLSRKFIKRRLRRKCVHSSGQDEIELATVPSEEQRKSDNVTACYIPTDETALHTTVVKDTKPDESTTLLEKWESGAETNIEGRTADGPCDACARTTGTQSKPDKPSTWISTEGQEAESTRWTS